MAETTAIQKANIGQLISEGVGAGYCSIENDGKDRKKAAQVYNALNNPEFRVADYINKDIAVTDVLIEISEIINEETGEVDTVPRVVLIDEDGKAYQAVSVGMFNCIKNAIKVFGEPTWDPALVFTIKQRSVKNGSMLTAEIKG